MHDESAQIRPARYDRPDILAAQNGSLYCHWSSIKHSLLFLGKTKPVRHAQEADTTMGIRIFHRPFREVTLAI